MASSAYAPAPRGLRPGFQASGMPVAGSRAAMPGRGTAPGPVAVVAVRVVHPPLVAADVHGRAGDRDGQQRVAAGVRGPGAAARRHRRRRSRTGPRCRTGCRRCRRRWWRPRSSCRPARSRRPARTCRTPRSSRPPRSPRARQSVRTAAVAPDRSHIAIWSRGSPSTVLKLPMAISRLPSGVMSILLTPTAALAPPPASVQLWLVSHLAGDERVDRAGGGVDRGDAAAGLAAEGRERAADEEPVVRAA